MLLVDIVFAKVSYIVISLILQLLQTTLVVLLFDLIVLDSKLSENLLNPNSLVDYSIMDIMDLIRAVIQSVSHSRSYSSSNNYLQQLHKVEGWSQLKLFFLNWSHIGLINADYFHQVTAHNKWVILQRYQQQQRQR